jgi:hypothetical protein
MQSSSVVRVRSGGGGASIVQAKRLIQPPPARNFDVSCASFDRVVEMVPIAVVFFYERHLDVEALANAVADALAYVPVYAGRISVAGTAMRIRCQGQGVSFTVASSERTLQEAIRSNATDRGHWLVDIVNVISAHQGHSPLLTVRVTHLSDGATAIGCSFHHSVGDFRSFMLFMNAWGATASGEPVSEALIVEDRSAYLDEHLPPDGASVSGLRVLRFSELARLAIYAAKDARKKRTLSLYFADDEIRRMRDDFGLETRLTANDVVCAQITEALMLSDPTIARRSLGIPVNVRKRCGLDPMLLGNMVTLLQLDVRRGETAATIARRIRHCLDHFSDKHLDMRSNLKLVDAACGRWGAYRCVNVSFDVTKFHSGISNWCNEGLHRVRFAGVAPAYVAPVANFLLPGSGAVVEGADGRGMLLTMTLPPETAEAMAGPTIRAHLRRFRRDDDDIPRLYRDS